jgi:hypothetical protein
VWIYDDEGYKQQGIIIRSYISTKEGPHYKVKYGLKLDREWHGSAHNIAYSPKITTPPPSPTYSEVEERLDSGAKPTRDPGIRARIRGRGMDWGDPGLFLQTKPYACFDDRLYNQWVPKP